MSFRDTFTRNNSSSQNLQYDDTAAYHFLTTILLIVGIPLIYNIIKIVLNPFGHIPKLKEVETKPQFTKKIAKFKKQNKYKYITCWFVFKIMLVVVVIFGLFHCFMVLRERGDNMKGFDPYQILEVQQNAPIQKIKKSYRKLALKYHPDRNQDDPEANAKFIMISKAYECLTDETAKQNCMKFGNPEGTSSFNVGIALPSFLVKKQNQVVIMGIVFVIVVIVLPLFLIYYFGEVNKYDEYGMLQESHPLVHGMLNQQLSIKDCVKTMSVCAQFKNLKIMKSQIQKLESLLKQSEEDYTKLFKKNFLNYIKKAIVLIDARITEKKVPLELMDDFKYIMKTVPIIVKSTIMAGNQRSNQMVARFRPEVFVGGNALSSLIMFGQYFIQGKSMQSESFEQLDLSEDQIDKIYKKKKKRNLNLSELHKNQQQKTFVLSTLNPEKVKYIEDMIAYFPRIEEMQVIVHTAGDKQLTTMDNIEVIVNLKSNRKSNFCNAVHYPFLKMEGWWLMVTDRNYVVHLEHFGFENSQVYQAKFYRGAYREPGNYSLNVKIFSDCYFGLDIQKMTKFSVKQPKKVEVETVTQDDLDQDESFFGRLMKSVIPQQEQELSDRQDEPTRSGNKREKKMVQQSETEEKKEQIMEPEKGKQKKERQE